MLLFRHMILHPITRFHVSACTVPTETTESDGTLNWKSTTIVIVQLAAGETWGLGYTYGNPGLKSFAVDLINKAVIDEDAFSITGIWGKLVQLVRNEGRTGESSMVISAIDNALWDLKAKLLQLPLLSLLGQSRERVEGYGSGGFNSYTHEQLEHQITSWLEQGFKKMKVKITGNLEHERARLSFIRRLCGPEVQLFVDANEACDKKVAREFADLLKELKIIWFEQPIFAYDLKGMHDFKLQMPTGIYLTTGEYVYNLTDLSNILQADAADVIQLDVTRCEGVSGFLKCSNLCEAYDVPISTHCAPALTVSPACSVGGLKHIEYFFDHARLENMLFDGVPQPRDGYFKPDLSRLGNGLILKKREIEKFEV